MVATLRLRQLQKDVNEAEEAELRRLENGATAGGDGDRPASPQTGGGASGGDEPSGNVHEDGSAGVVVAGAKQRAEQLDSKKFVHGGFRDSHKVTGLQPRGGAGLKAKVPKRKDFNFASVRPALRRRITDERGMAEHSHCHEPGSGAR